MTRLIVFLATTFAFTSRGVCVGHLIATSIQTSGIDTFGTDAMYWVMIAYFTSSACGLAIGLVISCFGLWLLGPMSER